MKNQLFFYKEAGSNFIVVHKFAEDGTILRYAAGEGEHGLDLIVRSGHGLEEIRKELEQVVQFCQKNCKESCCSVWRRCC